SCRPTALSTLSGSCDSAPKRSRQARAFARQACRVAASCPSFWLYSGSSEVNPSFPASLARLQACSALFWAKIFGHVVANALLTAFRQRRHAPPCLCEQRFTAANHLNCASQ